MGSEGDDPKDSHHKPLRTMTFTLQIKNNSISNSKEDLLHLNDQMLKMHGDSLLENKDEEYSDEFMMDEESEDDQQGYTPGTLYTHEPDTGIIVISGGSEEKISLGWKLEAIKGYLANEKEQMSGGSAWWKNISADISSDLMTAHIDFI